MVLLAALLAFAAPPQVTQQGRLLDTFGVGINGAHTASFALYDTATADQMLYSTGDMTLDFIDGYYAVKLGPLPAPATSAENLWVQITVNDSALEPLQQLGAVPFSLSAQAPPESVDWLALSNIPDDFADGTDAVLTESEVDNYVSNNGFLTETNWATLQGIPSAFADGIDNTLNEAQVDSMVANNGYLTAVQWNQVQGMPSAFSDGVDNTLNEAQVDAMVADNGFLTAVQWNQVQGMPGAFSDGVDNTLNESQVDSMVANNGYVTSVSNGPYVSTLSGGNGGQWGSWSSWQWCPSNTFMCGMRTKVESDQGWNGDDTAMNDIQIACCQIQQ